LLLFYVHFLPFFISIFFSLSESSDMTEEQKAAEIERLQRQKEKNRMDSLMAKQRIQSYKMARERVRAEKQKRQHLLQVSQLQASQQAGGANNGGSFVGFTSFGSSLAGPIAGGGGGGASGASNLAAPSLMQRQDSMGQAPHSSRLLAAKTLTLEPLHDEYSRIFQSSMGGASAAGAEGASAFASALGPASTTSISTTASTFGTFLQGGSSVSVSPRYGTTTSAGSATSSGSSAAVLGPSSSSSAAASRPLEDVRFVLLRFFSQILVFVVVYFSLFDNTCVILGNEHSPESNKAPHHSGAQARRGGVFYRPEAGHEAQRLDLLRAGQRQQQCWRG
jgi:hypothetical protein